MTDVVDLHRAAGAVPGLDFTSPEPALRDMDANGVRTAVRGPIGRWAAVEEADGGRTLREWCTRWPDRFRRWATVNPWRADAAARLSHALSDGSVGLKLAPATQGFSLLQLPLVEPLLEVAAASGRPVYVVTGTPVAGEPLQVAELARRFPAVTFVLGRSGRTDFALDVLPTLAAAGNIVAETAYNGAGLIAEFVRRLGSGRVAFASDAPLTDLDLELARLDRAGLDASDLDAVLGGTARSLLATHEAAVRA